MFFSQGWGRGAKENESTCTCERKTEEKGVRERGGGRKGESEMESKSEPQKKLGPAVHLQSRSCVVAA